MFLCLCFVVVAVVAAVVVCLSVDIFISFLRLFYVCANFLCVIYVLSIHVWKYGVYFIVQTFIVKFSILLFLFQAASMTHSNCIALSPRGEGRAYTKTSHGYGLDNSFFKRQGTKRQS